MLENSVPFTKPKELTLDPFILYGASTYPIKQFYHPFYLFNINFVLTLKWQKTRIIT